MLAVDKLREYAKTCVFLPPQETATVCKIADEIEAECQNNYDAMCLEIERDYMLLPKDADGIPIHVGDMMVGDCPSGKHVCGEVKAIGDDFFYLMNVSFKLHGEYMHHYHAPTIEDVLIEMMEQAVGFSDAHTTVALNAISEYADKIRKCLEDGCV